MPTLAQQEAALKAEAEAEAELMSTIAMDEV
jgi:hypothetical protein